MICFIQMKNHSGNVFQVETIDLTTLVFLNSHTLSREVSAKLEILAFLAGEPLSEEQGTGSETTAGKSISGDLHKETNPLSGLIAFCQYSSWPPQPPRLIPSILTDRGGDCLV